ncbi:MAG: iron-containing alcohol dehydrogenase, partial [Deltaproteobacteria bacterium]|nr:iron-containing alcohol dehydrogenase [Deltaproteobacteria bacterium]
ESGRKYMVVPTAASVDGYSAYGAAILVDGFKQTIDSPAPLAIVADTRVLKDAPPEMTAAGYGDLLGKITAGADWIIADSVNVEAVNPFTWEMVQKDLRKWLGQPERLLEGDLHAIEQLFEGLTVSGLAMQAQRSSRPASGTEHHFSHVWEMLNLEKDGIPVSHGFKVAIGTLAASAMLETVFAREIGRLDVDAACDQYPSLEDRQNQVRGAFFGNPAGTGVGPRDSESLSAGQSLGRRIVDQAGKGVVDRIVATTLAKHLTKDELRERLALVRSRWDVLRSRVKAQLLPYSELRGMLARAKCPTSPDQINLSRGQVRETFFLAQMIRERYTVLDLAYEMGWLEECVEEIFSSGAFL